MQRMMSLLAIDLSQTCGSKLKKWQIGDKSGRANSVARVNILPRYDSAESLMNKRGVITANWGSIILTQAGSHWCRLNCM